MRERGFTLIELLIVVAIIAILAAIAVPNFLEAQTRSKVSRVKADFRTMATAQESYRIDFGSYTVNGRLNPGEPPEEKGGYASLKSPIAYMSLVPLDPFGTLEYLGNIWPAGYWMLSGQDGYGNAGWDNGWATTYNVWPADIWYIASSGPDKEFIMDWSASGGLGALDGQILSWFPTGVGWGGVMTGPSQYGDATVRDDYADQILNVLYDPTNGTVSFGDIARSGGMPGYTRTLRQFRSATE